MRLGYRRPYGRGCYISEAGDLLIWVGGEDHLRATCTALQAENDAHRLELAEQRTELEAQVAAECAKRAGQY